MDKKLFTLVVGTTIIVLLIIGLVVTLPGKIKEQIKADLVDEVTQEVIERLQRDYVPGPYSPGFDPDKMDIGK